MTDLYELFADWLAQFQPHPLTVGMLEGKRHIKERITMIARFNHNTRRGLLLSVLLLLVIASVALTGQAQPKPIPPTQPATLPAVCPKALSIENQQALAILDKRLPEWRIEAMPLSQVIDELRTRTGANIFVNWRAIEAAGIPKDTPVSGRFRDIKYSKLLTVLLNEASQDKPKLAYQVDLGVIEISTLEEIQKSSITIQVYDIRDLLGVTGERKLLVDNISKLLQDTVDRGSWIGNGGKIGELQFLSGHLIITQIPENHRQVIVLLDKLRETRQIQISIEMRLISLKPDLLDKLGKDLNLDIKSPRPTNSFPNSAGHVLDDAQVDQLIRATETRPESILLAAPRLLLPNGQEGTVRIGSDTAYVDSLLPATQPADGDQPKPHTGSVFSGVSINVQGTVSADRKYVIVTVSPKIATLLELQNAPYTSKVPLQSELVKKPLMGTRELKAIVTIPDQRTLLLANFRKTTDSPTGTVDDTLLLVKPTIIIPSPTPPQPIRDLDEPKVRESGNR